MVTVTYAWKAGRRYKVSAQAVGEELEKIESRYGRVMPHNVVTVAASPASILHPFFEWDNEKAATEHRLEQARSLIRCVTVAPYDGHEPSSPIRAFVNISGDDGKEYNSIASVMGDDEKRERLLSTAKAELQDWRDRYRGLQEFAKLFDVIDQLGVAEERRDGVTHHSARLG